MLIRRTLPLIVLLLTCAVGASWAQQLVGPQVNPSEFGIESVQEARFKRIRYVRVIPAALNGSEIRLELFDDVTVRSILRRRGRQLDIDTWVGSVEDDPVGSVIISKHASGIIFGKVETSEATFLIEHKAGPVHAVIELDPEQLPDEGPDDAVALPVGEPDSGVDLGKSAAPSVCLDESTCSYQTIDILVVYTDPARTALGGSDLDAQLAIANAVEEMNASNLDSGVEHAFRLVEAAFVTYTESGDGYVDIGRLREAADGYLDEVHVWRDTYGADLVSLITYTGACGLGYVQSDPTSYSSSSAFTTVSTSCLTGNRTLSHEVGHNMGMHHDWYVNSSTTPCTWHHGYVNLAAIGGQGWQRWRTIMAYNDLCADNGGLNCRRLGYWSNPANIYENDPMGTPRGESDPADATFGLNRAACQVTDFRAAATPPPAPPPPPTPLDNLLGSAGPLDGLAGCGGSGSYEVNVIDGVITRVGDTGFTDEAVGSSCWRFSGPYNRVYIEANDPGTFDHWESPSGHIGFINGHNGTTTTTVETSFNTNSDSPTFQAIHAGGSPTPDLLIVDEVTGNGSKVAAASGGTSTAYPALALHPSTDVLYAGGGSGSPILYELDAGTGSLSQIGIAGSSVVRYGDMDFRSDGTLFASVNLPGFQSSKANHLATINVSTGAATIIGPFGSCSGTCTIDRMEAIAFDDYGTLWGVADTRGERGTLRLYTINTSTGTATLAVPLAGTLGASATGGITSLQFVDGVLYGGTAPAITPGVDGGYLVQIKTTSGAFWRVGGVGGSSATGGRGLNGLALRPSTDVGQDTIVFSVDLSPLEDVGIFDPNRGDTVEVRGPFNGWFCEIEPNCQMTQRPGENIFDGAFPVSGSPGEQIFYKYYFKPNLAMGSVAKSGIVDNPPSGWEEPLSTGGANRSFLLPGISGTTVLETTTFSDLEPGNLIPGNDSIEVTFTVDMTEALTDPGGPFNPAGGDKVHLLFGDPLWVSTQDLLFPEEGIDTSIVLSHGVGNLYTGSMMLKLPTHSGIQFQYTYGQYPSLNNEPGSGCCQDPGRRRVRYVIPFFDGSWPTTWSFPVDTFMVAGALPVDSNHVTTGVEYTGKVFLEGAYAGGGLMSVAQLFVDSRPTLQPYGDSLFDGTALAYPHEVAVSGFAANRVDWAEVELRRAIDHLSTPNGGKRLALVRKNGGLSGLAGGPVIFPGVAPGHYYVLIRHRNHASVMSALPVDFTTGSASWGFSTGLAQAYTTGPPPMKDLGDGNFAMFAGDASVDGEVTVSDFSSWLIATKLGLQGYQQADFNFDGHATVGDFSIWFVNTKVGAQSQVPDP